MPEEIPITEVRSQLTSLSNRLAKRPQAVAVTRRGKPVLAILPWDLYETLTETMDIMADEESLLALRQGIREIERGKAIPWDRAKKKLGW